MPSIAIPGGIAKVAVPLVRQPWVQARAPVKVVVEVVPVESARHGSQSLYFILTVVDVDPTKAFSSH